MPMAIPLIGAAVAAGAGYAAITAVGATLASQVIGGVMIAGAAMTTVGTVTGNKKLARIGTIATLAGGAAGLATGAWEATASTLADQAGEQAAQEAFRASEITAQNAAAVGAEGGGMLTAGEFAGLQAPGAAAAPTQQFAQAAAAAPAQPAAAATTIAAPAQASVATEATTGAMAAKPAAAAASPSSTAALTKPAIAVNGPGTGGGMLDTLKSGVKWATASPENARITQAGMGMLTGIGMTYAQQEALKEQLAIQEAAQQRARARISASVQGIKGPVYVRPGG